MDQVSIETMLTALAGASGGTLTTGSLVFYLIKKFVKDNEKKHDQTAEAFRLVGEKLSAIGGELAAIKTSLGQVIALRDQIQVDHDNVIRFEERTRKMQSDLQSQWDRVKDLTKEIDKAHDNISNFITTFNREAKS